MCGICGFVGFRDDELLYRMTNKLYHRGPDEDGYFISEYVSLGVRRLSVIDLKTGKQPIYNEDKTLVLVFNGEIYNYLELKELLILKGHKFYTNTDTEVIVHLYEEYKEECLKYLYGMFSFALFDIKSNKLFLARDPIGIKPLYYTIQNDTLIFASELKSILQCEKINFQINFYALDTYLTYLYIPSPMTVFKNIYKLPAGHYLEWKDKNTKIKQYWELKIKDVVNLKSEQEYVEEIKYMLRDVIRQHLRSDVDLGVFLSGGLDSSTIVALSAEMLNKPLKTFNIGYADKKDSEFNELTKARIVAERFKCEHYEYLLKPDIVELLHEIVSYFDEPFADSSAIATYLISKVSRKEVKVALTGIGGDELFGGYPRYLGAKLFVLYKNIPFVLRRFLRQFAGIMRETGSAYDWQGRIKRFLLFSNSSMDNSYKSWLSFLTDEIRATLYTKDFYNNVRKDNIGSIMDEYFLLLKSGNLEKIFYVDLKTYLTDDLLCLADRMSMASSLELRVPFCDVRLVEVAAQIPFNIKTKNFSMKYIIKKAMKKILPNEILVQRKMGFMIPLKRWTTEEMKSLINEYLSETAVKNRGYFNFDSLSLIIRQHLEGKRNFADLLYAILVLEVWHKLYIDNKFYKNKDYLDKIEINVFKQTLDFSKKRNKTKVLLFNVAGLGDFIESIPAIKHLLEERFKNDEVHLVVSDKYYDYARRLFNNVNIYEWATSKGYGINLLNIKRYVSGLFKLRNKKFEIFINLNEIGSKRGAVLLKTLIKFLRVKKTVGRDTNGLGKFFDVQIKDDYNMKKNEFDFYSEISQVFDINIKKLYYNSEDLLKKEFDINKYNLAIDKIVCFGIGSDRKTRLWNAENFARVADYVVSKGYSVVLLGSKQHFDLGQKIIESISDSYKSKVVNLCGKTTIDEVVWLLSKSKLVVSTNSAFMHISTKFSVPTVGLIGPGNPYRDKPFCIDENKFVAIWKPVGCNPCYFYTCPLKEEKMKCMKSITAQRVINEVNKFLE